MLLIVCNFKNGVILRPLLLIKSSKFISRVSIDSQADPNCIKEGLIPTKYFQKTVELLYGASGKNSIFKMTFQKLMFATQIYVTKIYFI